MTEEEKREFEEFLQWKEAKKKYEEEKKREQEEAERVKERAKAVNISDSTVKWPVEDIYPDRKMPKALLFLLVCAFGLLVYMLSTVVHETNNASPSRATKGDTLVQDSLLSTGEAGTNGKNKRRERIEKAKRIEELKHSIKLEKAYLTPADVSGSVHAFLIWKNVSSQNILSLDWRGYPTNAKGEPVACEIDGNTESGGHFIGPAVPGGTYGDDFGWYYLWHNPSARKLVLTSIDIEYDDGSKIHISQDELKYIR